VSRIQLPHTYEDIISVNNLLSAWKEFLKGKRKKKDVQIFERNLMANVLALHKELDCRFYVHGGYHAFKVNDPKQRDIHKAMVRDRLLHHAIYRKLYPFFDYIFISDSYSCRQNKGTHRAMSRFKSFAHEVSKNNTRTCWVLKCDIRKFFASVDQAILLSLVRERIKDTRITALIQIVVTSFHSGSPGKGLPLGNLTSQLLVNVYMNEFDQFVKHALKAKQYIRYADDFVFLSHDRTWLVSLIPCIEEFLRDNLKLELHPKKVSIDSLTTGVDYLGWVHFPHHRVLRTVTKRRMFRRIKDGRSNEAVRSYLGILRYGNGYKLGRRVEEARPQVAVEKRSLV